MFFYILIKKDLKHKENGRYYLLSLFVVALVFIYSYSGLIGVFLALMDKLLISVVTITFMMVYVVSNLIGFVEEVHHKYGKKS